MPLATVDEHKPLREDTTIHQVRQHHVRTIRELLVKYSAATDSINAALNAMQEVCFDKVNADILYADTVASMKLKSLREDLFIKRNAAIAAAAALDAANAACTKDVIYAKAVAAIESYAGRQLSADTACRLCVRKCIDEASDNQKAAKEAADEANGYLVRAKEAIHMIAKEMQSRIISIDRRYRQDEERTRNMFDEALLARKCYFIEEFQETFSAFL